MNISYIIKTDRVKSRHLLAFSTTKAWAITLNTILIICAKTVTILYRYERSNAVTENI